MMLVRVWFVLLIAGFAVAAGVALHAGDGNECLAWMNAAAWCFCAVARAKREGLL